MKFHVRTYGCQMNERDTEAVSALLARHGHVPVANEQDAEIIIVNTCSVRGKAEDKALGKLGLLVAAKRNNPMIVGVMGCMVQRLKERIFTKVPGLDFAVGTHRIAMLPGIIDMVCGGAVPVLDVAERNNDDVVDLTGHSVEGPSAFVNILLGCNRRCAYCIVPTVRGQEYSRSVSSIISEVKALVANGVKDVTLLGQSVMRYGLCNQVWPDGFRSELGFAEPLPRLLEAVNQVDGLARVRFTSGHPSGCTEDLVRAMAELQAVCEHLHLPVQSGSDRILKMMGRGYTANDYREAVRRLRTAVPDIAITTDVIVGFPSETVEEFDMTRAFMQEIGFDNAFIFKYSPRSGTPAADLVDDVSDEEKRRRNQVLLKDQDVRGHQINQGLIGKTVEVLVEGVSARNRSRWSGRTRTNKIVIFEPIEDMTMGDLVKVKIDAARAQTLYGKVEGQIP